MLDPMALIITALILVALGWLIKFLNDFDIIEDEGLSFGVSIVFFIGAIVLDIVALIIII